MATIANLQHPEYSALFEEWEKFRFTYIGGTRFIDEFLVKYSLRETSSEFEERRRMSYCPAHAKAAINDIKNAIFQRTTDVNRKGGSKTFLDAASGNDPSGIDFRGNTMNSYIGRILLPELLIMAKVGVYVDRKNSEIDTRKDELASRPYVYHYVAEDIRSWAYDNEGRLITVLLRDRDFKLDNNNLPVDERERFRMLWIDEENKVKVQFFNDKGDSVDLDNNPSNDIFDLNLKEIPFVIFELNNSLLTDAADYQIALELACISLAPGLLPK